MPKDYCVVLGVSRGAYLNKIKKAYRTVVKKLHPDISSTKESEEKFLEAREAYETLCDERFCNRKLLKRFHDLIPH
jgi:DnaJ-class molecular chaperone